MGTVGVPEIRWMRSSLNSSARRAAFDALSPVERERFASTPAATRDSYLAGRLLLRRLAADLTESTPEAVALSAVCPDCGGAHGRPVLADSSLQLSLSRTPLVVVAAAHWGAAVGIDVEDLDQPIARLAAIEAMTGRPSVQAWTRVEAVLKADGRGLRVDPSLVTFDESRATVADRDTQYDLSEVDLAPSLRVSVAVAV
jgi:4'-phosphopantetheinyl transferase